MAGDQARAKEAPEEAHRALRVAETSSAKLSSQVNGFRDETDEALRLVPFSPWRLP